MGKRIVSNFSRSGFPSSEAIDEDGQAKPSVYAVPWVIPDTLKVSLVCEMAIKGRHQPVKVYHLLGLT
jgi:hypothetical protein